MGSILRIPRVQLPPVLALGNGVPCVSAELEAGCWRYFLIRVPPSQAQLVITAQGEGLDLFVRHGNLPARHSHDFQAATHHRDPTARITIAHPGQGDWYLGVFGWRYEDIGLTATYVACEEQPLPAPLPVFQRTQQRVS